MNRSALRTSMTDNLTSSALQNPTGPREAVKALVVTTFAVIGTTAIALGYGFALTPTLQIVGMSVGAAVITALGALLVLRLARSRSIGSQAGLLFVAAGTGTALAAWLTARRMFLSQHDFAVLMMVLVISGAAAGYEAIAFGRRMNRSANRLVELTRTVDLRDDVAPVQLGASRELGRVARAFDAFASRVRTERSRAEQSERSRRDLVVWVHEDIHERLARIEDALQREGPQPAEALQTELLAIRSTLHDVRELLQSDSSGLASDAAVASTKAL